jgi:predicted transcriptional regulator of viral defense system
MRGEPHARGPDARIAVLAEAQHGVVARRQLLKLGLSTQAIDRRRERGRLHDLRRGVYSVGHRRLTRRGRWMAATLAAGPDAVLSHRSAGALWDLFPDHGGLVEVTSARQIAQPGLRTYRHRLAPDESAVVDGIPITTVARTLLDLTAVLARPRLARAVERAEALRLADETSLR